MPGYTLLYAALCCPVVGWLMLQGASGSSEQWAFGGFLRWEWGWGSLALWLLNVWCTKGRLILTSLQYLQKGGGRGLLTADRATGRDRPVGRSPVGRADWPGQPGWLGVSLLSWLGWRWLRPDGLNRADRADRLNRADRAERDWPAEPSWPAWPAEPGFDVAVVVVVVVVVVAVVEGSLNSKLPTIWTVEKQSRVVKSAERRCNSAKVRRKKIHPCQMLEKSRNAVFFSMIRVSGQSKSRPVKAAGAESCGQRRNEKLHAAVAKSTCGSENIQNTSAPKHFLKFWCRKIARRCGEKHILKSKC